MIPTMESKMKCPNCSQGLIGAEKFCPNCGSAIVFVGKSESSETDAESVTRTLGPNQLVASKGFYARLLDQVSNLPEFYMGSSTYSTGRVTPPEVSSDSGSKKEHESTNDTSHSAHESPEFDLKVLKSGVSQDFVISNLIIAAAGMLSTCFPYLTDTFDNSKSGLGVSIYRGFSDGGKIFFLISLLFSGIGAIHFTNWIRGNEIMTAALSGLIGIASGATGLIVLLMQSASISSSLDSDGLPIRPASGIFLGYAVALAMIGFGAVCFLNPRFFKEPSSK